VNTVFILSPYVTGYFSNASSSPKGNGNSYNILVANASNTSSILYPLVPPELL